MVSDVAFGRGRADARADDVLRRLELVVTRRLDGILGGDHQGLVPGEGSEPGEGRPYVPGDDVRRMDWSLTARTGVAHVRQSIADRELTTTLVVDATPSMDFGTAAVEKRQLALAAAAAFGFLTARGGNRVGAVIASDRPDIVPARTGRDATFALLRRVERAPRLEAGAGTPLHMALTAAAAAASRRGLVAVISDFLDPPGSWARPLRVLAARHQVVAVEVRDPREDDLPPVGVLTLVDPETGRRLEVQTAKAGVRRRFADAAAARRGEVGAAVRRAGASHLVLSTDRDWLLDVVRFVALSRRRR